MTTAIAIILVVGAIVLAFWIGLLLGVHGWR